MLPFLRALALCRPPPGAKQQTGLRHRQFSRPVVIRPTQRRPGWWDHGRGETAVAGARKIALSVSSPCGVVGHFPRDVWPPRSVAGERREALAETPQTHAGGCHQERRICLPTV